jgi:hypothetical protein
MLLIVSMGFEFRVFNSLTKAFADDGFYPSITAAERARDALLNLE